MLRWRTVVIAVMLVSSVAAPGCSRIEAWRANRAFEAGAALARQQKTVEALAKFDEAIALQHDYLPARLARGKALQDLKRHDEAIAEFDTVLRVDPSSADALEGRGLSKEAQQIGSGVGDLNAALRGPAAASTQTPLVVTGVPPMMLLGRLVVTPVPGGGSQAAAVIKGQSPAVPELGSYFKNILRRQRKSPRSTLKDVMDRLDQTSPPAASATPPIDPTAILDWAGLSDEEIDAQSAAIDRLSPKADLDETLASLDGITELIKAGKKDPTKPASSFEWSFTFDGPAFLADFYKRPLVAYFPGSTDWKSGLKALGALMPIANSADFYLANPDYEPTRAEVARTTRMFGVTRFPAVVVVRMKSPVKGGAKKENLESQVRCEGRSESQCAQEVLAWFNVGTR
jgi:tetratricopeptide (TPR) repeat protein